MTDEQLTEEQALSSRLFTLGYTDDRYTFKMVDGYQMLYVNDTHISSVSYALALDDDELRNFIEITCQVHTRIVEKKKTTKKEK
jgi:hypothetical protein